MNPTTISGLLNQISELQSRKAIYLEFVAHLRICYRGADSGPAEMRITREDLAVVPERHIDAMIIELEERIHFLNAEIEELQDQPFGGEAPPQVSEGAAASSKPKRKGVVSGKSRSAQGSGPS